MSSGVSFRATLPNCRGHTSCKPVGLFESWVCLVCVESEYQSAYWNPKQSMYGIFTYIYNKHKPNVVKYTWHRWYMGIEIPKRSRTATWRWKKHGFEDVGIQESIIASGFSRSILGFDCCQFLARWGWAKDVFQKGEPKIHPVLWAMAKINHSQKVGSNQFLHGVTTPIRRVITLVINL